MPGSSTAERVSQMGSRIRQMRLQRDLKQKELAHRIGIKSSHLSDIERGKKNPSYVTLGKISEELDASLDYLLLDSVAGSKSHLRDEQLANIIEQYDARSMQRLVQYAQMLLEDQQEHESEIRKLMGEWEKVNCIRTVDQQSLDDVELIEP